jgi:hypothetical protein
MSHLKPIDKLYLSNKYMNHGDRSSNDEYYLPCITMYLFLKYYNLCGNNFLMNKPYVYSWSNTDEFSQNSHQYEKNIRIIKNFIKTTLSIQ